MSARGFTLIEVMVSLFILAVMAGMAWQGVDLVVRSRDASRNRTESILRLQTVISQWEADLRAMATTEAVPGFEAQGNAMRLTRRTDQGLQVVIWTVRGGSWYRWASPPYTAIDALQEAWFTSYQLLGNEPGTLRALSGIAGLQLYTFWGNAWTNAQSTGELASDGATVLVGTPATANSPSTATATEGQAVTKSAQTRQALPDGVRLQISFSPGAALADLSGAKPVGGMPPVTGVSGTITRVLQLVHP